ncbi:hypothetical protein DENSPDRAFT_343194 [Dentipellis sp. KUC8613]|nr:hypothetical protein DENSPDRAFT_343194 [Dentipellis sp. KUC8613]
MAAGPSIDNTIGAAFIGWGISGLVFGILSIQCYTYFQRYPNDSIAYKTLVGSLWALEALHQGLVGHCVYFYDVRNYGNLLVFLETPVWSLSIQVALGAFVGAIVKGCFGLRVWKFSKHNIWVTAVIMLMTLAQLGFACAYTVRAFHVRLIEASQLKVIGTTSLALGAATDIFTAASLSFFLHQMRTGYAKSDSLINRLILYSVNTGFLTSAVSIAVLALYNTMPQNFIFMSFYFVLSKLYANSCLATLNTRRFVRGKGTDREEGTGPSFMMVGNPFRSHGRAHEQHHHQFSGHKSAGLVSSPIEVDVRHEVSVLSDADPDPAGYAKAW